MTKNAFIWFLVDGLVWNITQLLNNFELTTPLHRRSRDSDIHILYQI